MVVVARTCILVIENRHGLHARAAAQLVKLAGGYRSRIELSYRGRSAAADNLLGLMMLAAAQGAEVEVSVDGSDADTALSALRELFRQRFHEE